MRWLSIGVPNRVFLAVALSSVLCGCATVPLPDGEPVPPNYYIHRLSTEGGGG